VILLRRLRNLTRFAYVQLLVDTVFVSAIIYSTGGIESVFSFLYILVIITGSILLYRRGGMLAASSSSIQYGLMADLQYYGLLRPLGGRIPYPADFQGFHFLYLALVNISAFYLVAYLSSYLSEQIRRGRAELRARQSDILELEVLNQSIINSMDSGLIALDSRQRIVLFNPAAERIFGVRGEEAIGRSATDILPFLGECLREDHGVKDGRPKPPPPIRDWSCHHPLGSLRHLRFTHSDLRLPGGTRDGHIFFFQDVTALREIELEMKKVEGLALIGELAAGIAHEIRNPLASISGSVQMLREGSGQGEVNRRLMDIVLREINRLNHLINDFLLFARPKKTLWKPVDLGPLIVECLELFQRSPHWDKRIHVQRDLRLAAEIVSDPEQIKQVLLNLFLNAAEAMPQGGTLFVGTEGPIENDHRSGGAEPRVRITVRDTGEGFQEKALGQLFTPFYTTKPGGSGLGLAIVKRIVEGLEGEVHGRNHEDGGAELTLELPLSPRGVHGLSGMDTQAERHAVTPPKRIAL
jgi:two-component system sensor histidine kinase PilS (NtrC family)